MILVVDNLGDESWGRVLISFWGLSTVELWTGLGLVRDCSDCKGVRVEEFKGYGWLEARCMLVWVRWLVEGMGNERVMRSGSMVLGWDGCEGSLLNGARAEGPFLARASYAGVRLGRFVLIGWCGVDTLYGEPVR